MAGMFYSIQETAEKLGISENEVKQLAKDGKLREFRDGENIMFKVDEVDNIHDQESALRLDVMDEADSIPEAEPDLALSDELEPVADLDMELPEDDLQLDEEPMVLEEANADVAEASASELDALMDLDLGEDTVAAAPTEDLPNEEDLQLAEASEPELDLASDDLDLAGLDEVDDLALAPDDEPQIDLSDTQVVAEASEPVIQDISLDDAGGTDDILLAGSATEEPALADTLGDGLADDTAITGEGINVLGETDGDYKLTDDTMAETLAGLGATGEASLEEIEEDVNLDSFGSGSGLLDLSLQADDTSLGGILDEIYTNEDEDGAAPAAEQASTEDMTAEVDQLTVSDEMPEADMGMVAAPMAVAAAIAEVEPDASSNTLGSLLFLPMFLFIYTAIVALSASKWLDPEVPGQLPTIASAISNIIWMVMGGLLVVALVWGGVGLAKGGSGDAKKGKKAKAKKPKKEKKAKTPKAKKEKKPKEKKEKKPLFGKKKKK